MLNEKKLAPVHLATEQNKVHALQVMGKYREVIDIQQGGEHGRTALHLAAIYDNEECARILVRALVFLLQRLYLLHLKRIAFLLDDIYACRYPSLERVQGNPATTDTTQYTRPLKTPAPKRWRSSSSGVNRRVVPGRR